ncbi:MAG: hypothetical protein H6832_18200 [Planctomycetes bacterium]|nr:hypothetical protein [Planctomycetota bacterium]MCB9892089.1 hypothetical protein [Planctomycetota bacterium]MCB9920339.1 hypothetical protein [Planctomycetota bacterium]
MMEHQHREPGSAIRRLPQCATVVFCAATLWVLFHDFVDAHTELRKAERLYASQLDRYQHLVDDVQRKHDEVWMLENDPQARERLLDQRGYTSYGNRKRDVQSPAPGDADRDEEHRDDEARPTPAR